jgi:hypothetical protein
MENPLADRVGSGDTTAQLDFVDVWKESERPPGMRAGGTARCPAKFSMATH